MTPIDDWREPDQRLTYKVGICEQDTRGVKFATTVLLWTGYADSIEDAKRSALRAAAMARAIATALDKAPRPEQIDTVQSAKWAPGDELLIDILEPITRQTMVAERRAMRHSPSAKQRSSTLSGQAIAAAQAILMLAAARADMTGNLRTWVEIAGDGHDAGYAISVHDASESQTWHPVLREATREALQACGIAFWMAGAPIPRDNPTVTSDSASATLEAARRRQLAKNAANNLAIATSFLRRIGLEEQARSLAELHA